MFHKNIFVDSLSWELRSFFWSLWYFFTDRGKYRLFRQLRKSKKKIGKPLKKAAKLLREVERKTRKRR